MGNLWKHFAEWVTDLRSDLFTWARIKLSVLYLLIVVVILIIFSVTIYSTFKDQTNEARHGRRVEEESFYDQAIDEIRLTLIVIDGVIFFAAAGLSYILAGYTLKPIQRALETQTAFAADASHELRTPLAILRGNTEIMLRSEKPLPETVRRLLNINLEEIITVSATTDQLLALARGQMPNKESFELIDLAVLTKAIVEKFKNIAAEKNITLSTKSLEEARIRGDKNGIERVLKNVLANAIAHTPARGSITAALAIRGTFAALTITDTGVGIPEKDIPHIFDRFYKVDHARTHTETGSGLGLAIVKQIIIHHRGTIHLQSTVGKGTTVSIRLPLA